MIPLPPNWGVDAEGYAVRIGPPLQKDEDFEAKHPRGKTTAESNDGSFAPKEVPMVRGDLEQDWYSKERRTVESGYKPPDTSAHEKYRSGAWGSSHSESYALAGMAAEIMGLTGFDTERINRQYAKPAATAMLQRIADDSVGSEEPLYHGFENVGSRNWRVGEVIEMPLTATSGDRGHAMHYGVRLDTEDQSGHPTMFEFPQGTPMLAYQKWKPSDAKDFGHVYLEAIVAGRFRVTGVRPVYLDTTWQHDRANHTAHHPTGTIVTLEPVEVFDPSTGQWRKVKTGVAGVAKAILGDMMP